MYYLVYGSLYLISLLPLGILYLISDFACFLLYRVFCYRIPVVRQNLAIAFPDLTAEERKAIEKKFYHNFTDNFIETLKLFSGGADFALKHFTADGSLMEEQFGKGHRCQFHLGHNFNWELANVMVPRISSYKMLMVYLPISNKVFNRVMLKLRAISGNQLLAAGNLKKELFPFRSTTYLLALIADQVPGDVTKAYWLNFFGRPTPFVWGPERGAVVGGLAVFFGHVFKTKRGHYQLEYELVTENAAELPPGELTRKYAKYLEQAMRAHPDCWLWSHRRWKREWKPEYEKLWIGEDPLPSLEDNSI